ncbi:MAG: hypothetical protein IPL61_09660 [Myxococcales bacterium]|nr:hypothetical protein [Myxococcales bacterium]
MRGSATAVVLAFLATLAAGAIAQPSEAVQKADELFQQGRALLDAGDAVAACPKFEESQRLDPGLGTLLNLADCYERTGRLGSALTAFRSAEEQARRLGERKRETAAADRARSLEGRVSRVTITVAAGERSEGFEVRRNGAIVPALDFGRPIAVDPGPITIEAVAPGREPFRRAIDISRTQSQHQVDIPVLAPTRAAPPPDDQVTPPPPPPLVAATVDAGAGRRRLGYIVGGLGVVGLGAGIAIGLKAKGDYGDANCPAGTCASAADLDQANDARRLGTIGTIVGGVGVAALATGVVLWLTAPRSRAVEIAPTASADGVGVTFAGRF